jgi:hypothetical protein
VTGPRTERSSQQMADKHHQIGNDSRDIGDTCQRRGVSRRQFGRDWQQLGDNVREGEALVNRLDSLGQLDWRRAP